MPKNKVGPTKADLQKIVDSWNRGWKVVRCTSAGQNGAYIVTVSNGSFEKTVIVTHGKVTGAQG